MQVHDKVPKRSKTKRTKRSEALTFTSLSLQLQLHFTSTPLHFHWNSLAQLLTFTDRNPLSTYCTLQKFNFNFNFTFSLPTSNTSNCRNALTHSHSLHSTALLLKFTHSHTLPWTHFLSTVQCETSASQLLNFSTSLSLSLSLKRTHSPSLHSTARLLKLTHLHSLLETHFMRTVHCYTLTSQLSTSLHFSSLHFSTFHFHCCTLHFTFISLHFTALYCIWRTHIHCLKPTLCVLYTAIL